MHKEDIQGQLSQQAKEGPLGGSSSALSGYTPVFLGVCFTFANSGVCSELYCSEGPAFY